MKGLFLSNELVVFLLVCFFSFVVKEIPLWMRFGDLRELWLESEVILNLSPITLRFLFTLLLCSFSVLSNSFISICLTFLFPSFYFPCCFSYLMCSLCLALCVETSGYEMAGWVSETSLSVWQSLWYISRPLPCIIDFPLSNHCLQCYRWAFTASSACTPRSFWQLKSWLRHNFKR